VGGLRRGSHQGASVAWVARAGAVAERKCRMAVEPEQG
jgi:hypothetical protein